MSLRYVCVMYYLHVGMIVCSTLHSTKGRQRRLLVDLKNKIIAVYRLNACFSNQLLLTVTCVFIKQYSWLQVSTLSGRTRRSGTWRNSYYPASGFCSLSIYRNALAQPLVALLGRRPQSLQLVFNT